MNQTFRIASLVDCGDLSDRWVYNADSLWRQTLVGCRILQILQDMYGFDMSYEYKDVLYNTSIEASSFAGTVDLYARPMALTRHMLIDAYPVLPIVSWRYGFLLRRSGRTVFQALYSLPFSKRLWDCLIAMTLLVSAIFYLLNWWEKRTHRLAATNECSYTYELLVTIAGFCQHVLPVRAFSQSRRIAYATFLLFSYIIYSYYSSNLLSHIVNDKDEAMTLEELMESDFNFVLTDNTKAMYTGKAPWNSNVSLVQQNLFQFEVKNTPQALEALRTTRTAVLCDYQTVYRDIMTEFNNKEICQLIEVDVFSNINRYFFTSKDFAYKEEFKIGMLRAKESGVLQRAVRMDYSHARAPRCAMTPRRTRVSAAHVLNLIILLASCHLLAVGVLIAERIYFSRNRVYHFVN